MNLLTFITSFLYRIRYKIIIGAVIAFILAWYLSSFMPVIYSVSSTVFTGITSKASVGDMSGNTDWNASNNAHENILHIIKSKSTLESISIKLIAQHLMYGANPKTTHITKEHYEQLLKITPAHVLELVDKTSFKRTVENLNNYRKAERGNFFYDVFNWDNKYYGYLSLSSIKAQRKGVSDMIEITYQCDDPGIASSTLTFLNEELILRYEGLLLSASNDVVKYFEEQLELAKERMNKSEDELVAFNIEHGIINYEEQTKHLAALNNNFEGRYEEVLMTNSSSEALVNELEAQMDMRTKLVFQNETFLKALSDISILNGKIAEIEIFDSENRDTETLNRYKKELERVEGTLRGITDKIEEYQFSKEGVAIPDMVNEWLSALLKLEKSRAELTILEKRKKEIEQQYRLYSPVGPNLGKQLRNVRVQEEAYLTILHNLGLAKLRQKNILLDAGTLQIVAPPDYPLLSLSRKRKIIILAAVFGAIMFTIGFYLLIEMLDRTLRDAARATRLTKGKVIAAIPNSRAIKYRRYSDEINLSAIKYLGNLLNTHTKTDQPLIINLLSIEQGEGKSYIAEHMENYWQDHGLKVAYIAYDNEIHANSIDFLQASSIHNIPSISQQIQDANVIIVEYASLNHNNTPKRLLQEASVNLLILNAQRAWYTSDETSFANLNENLANASPLYICLNKVNREAVEYFTGQLPPYTLLRRLSYRLLNFGITAKS